MNISVRPRTPIYRRPWLDQVHFWSWMSSIESKADCLVTGESYSNSFFDICHTNFPESSKKLNPFLENKVFQKRTK